MMKNKATVAFIAAMVIVVSLTACQKADEKIKAEVQNPADDDWYMKGTIYTDENGNRAEVFLMIMVR